MKTTALIISLCALAGIIVPPLMFIGDAMALDVVQSWMLVATLVWFATALVWME